MALGMRDKFGGESGGYAPTVPRPVTIRPPRMGVVAFNNPKAPTSGVACVVGKRPVLFSNRSELPSDVIWISDADLGTNAQNFRSSSYLRSGLKQIADDLGVNLSDTVDGLPLLAETIGRVRDIAAHAYPWLDLSVDWSHATFSDCVAKILPPSGEVDPSMESALLQSYQKYSTVVDSVDGGYGGTGSAFFSLRVNRLRYAQYLCSQNVPRGSWASHLDAQRVSLDRLLDPAFPCLVEATVECLNVSEVITPNLIAFSSSRPGGKDQIRRWVSQPELAWLVEHANVHISSVYIATESAPLAQEHQLPAIITADPVYALSVAAGIIAENHWVGLTTPMRKRRAGPSATARFVDVVTPAAVWLRALDRAYTFQMAATVAKWGYKVRSYGYGSVVFRAPKGEIRKIMELADELGASHPCLAAMEQRLLFGHDSGEES